jgi:periplasmic protein TonB
VTNKLILSIFPAAVMTALLFYLMHVLIRSDEIVIDEKTAIVITEFVRVLVPPVVILTNRKVERPQEPEVPPKTSSPRLEREEGGYTGLPRELAAPGGPVIAGDYVPDGEYLPIVKVQPNYPRQALRGGYHGWVLLEFSVDELGRVVELRIPANVNT